MRLRILAALLLASPMFAGFGTSVSAQSDAVSERVNLMRSNGMTMRGAMRATGDDAVAAARTLAGNFGTLPKLFDDPSAPGDTLPAAWENRDAFLALFAEAEQHSLEALEAAQAGDMDAYGVALQKVGQTCSSCHGTFRR
ncbi:c-type cytochrome [Pelagibacterium limicola]|uniref:c-type cytochrome n=1 Tax=Pelagibacterium limicola TaxID=2791022 RepID=UPI0018B0140A|nr:cytochrome c [Pelagibacterium limicola]